MTEQKAIARLKHHIEWGFSEPTKEALEMAIKALEKQIPKKPLFGTVHNDTAYYCGSCKNFIGFYDTRIYEYCHNCGQKLDWRQNERT